MHIDDHFGRSPFQDFEVMHGDLARLKFHFFTFARHFVGFASLHFDGRVGRGSLFDFANKGFERFFELRFGDIERVVRSVTLPSASNVSVEPPKRMMA